ncbi:EspF repeat-containing protein [Obesumbacterium proteus]|uniref:EspF repeat-containing protein n=1 Tax=Obesumbacterium proteus TaxID=82983 RepID=UPI003C6E252B
MKNWPHPNPPLRRGGSRPVLDIIQALDRLLPLTRGRLGGGQASALLADILHRHTRS